MLLPIQNARLIILTGAYIHWNAGSGLAVNFTNDWQTFDKTIVVNADMVGSGGQMQTFAWNLAASRGANKYYFDDIVMEKLVSANSIPLTDQEKKDTLIWAMDKWISGMMEACDGKVKAWDVVNEAISGGDPDSEGVYALQHDNGDANNFFWQDYWAILIMSVLLSLRLVSMDLRISNSSLTTTTLRVTGTTMLS